MAWKSTRDPSGTSVLVKGACRISMLAWRVGKLGGTPAMITQSTEHW